MSWDRTGGSQRLALGHRVLSAVLRGEKRLVLAGLAVVIVASGQAFRGAVHEALVHGLIRALAARDAVSFQGLLVVFEAAEILGVRVTLSLFWRFLVLQLLLLMVLLSLLGIRLLQTGLEMLVVVCFACGSLTAQTQFALQLPDETGLGVAWCATVPS